MKQIDIIKTYAQKSCLVVDDVPDVRTSLKRILVDFGSQKVDSAGSAEEAIELCEKHNYDIVLADYNLGPGKNGQQLLEEIRFQRYLKNTSLFIMITAESASQLVLHALENRPDDYLNKPITRENLRPRLDQALLKNEELLNVKQALDANKPMKAIGACEALLEHKSRFHHEIRKTLVELCIEFNRFDDIPRYCSHYPEERQPLWATLALAQAYIETNNLKTSEDLLTKVTQDNPMCVDALDLLAHLYELQNKLERSHVALTQAIKLSPRSAKRQRKLAHISELLGDKISAIHALRSAIKLGKNSCHESPEDSLHLVENLLHQASNSDPKDRSKNIDESSDILKYLGKKHSSHPIVNIRVKQLESDLHQIQDKEKAAELSASLALEKLENTKFSVIGNTSPHLCIDCAKTFMSWGKYDEGEKLLQELAKVNTDHKIAIQIDKLLREPLTAEGRQYAAKQNKMGIELYQKQEYEGAIKAFTTVLNELPNHIGLNLNLMQAIIGKAKETAADEKELALIANRFKRIGAISDKSEHFERFKYIKKKYDQLSQG